jgi:hypothetical protein
MRHEDKDGRTEHLTGGEMSKKMWIAPISLAITMLISAEATAYEVQSLTIYTKNDPKYSKGDLSACTLTFSTIFVDSELKGRSFFAEGAVGFFNEKNNNSMIPFIKIAVSERIEQAGKISPLPLKIENVSLYGDDELNSELFDGVVTENSDNPYAILSIHKMNSKNNEKTFLDLANSVKMSVAFTIKENGKKYNIDIDKFLQGVKDGKEVHSPDELLGFVDCNSKLINIAAGVK